jgi:hypothetical protein
MCAICIRRRKFRITAARISSLTLITAAEFSCVSSAGCFCKLYLTHPPNTTELRDTKYNDVCCVCR